MIKKNAGYPGDWWRQAEGKGIVKGRSPYPPFHPAVNPALVGRVQPSTQTNKQNLGVGPNIVTFVSC